jgi:hypothetical protein
MARDLSEFVKEYGELVKKHNADWATYPVFVPDGNGGFKIIIQSTPVDMTLRQAPEEQQDPNAYPTTLAETVA